MTVSTHKERSRSETLYGFTTCKEKNNLTQTLGRPLSYHKVHKMISSSESSRDKLYMTTTSRVAILPLGSLPFNDAKIHATTLTENSKLETALEIEPWSSSKKHPHRSNWTILRNPQRNLSPLNIDSDCYDTHINPVKRSDVQACKDPR